jgi:hypothetical protein
MPRRMLLLCAVLYILAQLSGCTRQKPSVPVQAVADTAPVRAEIQRIAPNKLEPVNVAVVPLD